MLLLKPRPVPSDLIILRSLNTRMSLTEEEKKYYLNREKGFEGEMMFDKLTGNLQSNCFILNDLLFEFNNTEFQIDSTLIFQETIKLFEVKNYEGDYYYESDKFYTNSGKLINNPLDQLKRCESLLQQLLQSFGNKITVEAYLVFINPEFTLYQSPRDQPIIFPTQVHRSIEKLNVQQSKLSGRHSKFADQLVAAHKTKSRNTHLPHYEYAQLKKGITCAKCHSFLISVGERKIVCGDCGAEEDVESAVMRTVKEWILLFPERKITTNGVQEWCRVIECKKRINRILKRNFKIMGHGYSSYYE
jgi:hypothetical protein